MVGERNGQNAPGDPPPGPRKWVPVVDKGLCVGCAACVQACGPQALAIGSDEAATLARPDVCVSDEYCIAPCPEGAIRMAWVSGTGDPLRGKWRE